MTRCCDPMTGSCYHVTGCCDPMTGSCYHVTGCCDPMTGSCYHVTGCCDPMTGSCYHVTGCCNLRDICLVSNNNITEVAQHCSSAQLLVNGVFWHVFNPPFTRVIELLCTEAWLPVCSEVNTMNLFSGLGLCVRLSGRQSGTKLSCIRLVIRHARSARQAAYA